MLRRAEMEDVERERVSVIPGRRAVGLRLTGGVGDLTDVGVGTESEGKVEDPLAVDGGSLSSSVHCRCRITDFVAHCVGEENITPFLPSLDVISGWNVPSFEYLLRRTTGACYQAPARH